MQSLAPLLVIFVAILHIWFLILEMFSWKKPLGRKTFKMSRERAETTAVLAANQGLYNGFLAGGLILSFFLSDARGGEAFRLYFLSCVIVAGIFGAWSANKSILLIQALPAAVALLLCIFTQS